MPEFVNDELKMFDPTNPNWERAKVAYDSNGLSNPASGYGYVEPASFLRTHHRRHKQDISEK